MTAHLKTPLPSSWSCRRHHTDQDGDKVCLQTGGYKELAVWCSLNNLELNMLKTVEMISGLQEKPPCSPPTHHHERLCDCSGVIQIPQHHNFSGTLKLNHIDSFVKNAQRRVVLPSPAEEVQPNTGAADRVLLCHHWIHPLHVNNCLFSSATKSDLRRLRRVVRTAERIIGTPLPTLQELYLSRVSKRAGKITCTLTSSILLFELLPSGRRYRALSTRTTRHREQFSSSSNPSHEHLTLTWNTQHYYYTLFIHHTYLFFISNLHMSDLYTHNCLYYIVFLLFVHCQNNLYIILYYLFLVLLLSFCCTVVLLSL